jgi:hypothetical protein
MTIFTNGMRPVQCQLAACTRSILLRVKYPRTAVGLSCVHPASWRSENAAPLSQSVQQAAELRHLRTRRMHIEASRCLAGSALIDEPSNIDSNQIHGHRLVCVSRNKSYTHKQ